MSRSRHNRSRLKPIVDLIIHWWKIEQRDLHDIELQMREAEGLDDFPDRGMWFMEAELSPEDTSDAEEARTIEGPTFVFESGLSLSETLRRINRRPKFRPSCMELLQ